MVELLNMKTAAALRAKADWLESTLESLLSRGVDMDAISIEEHPELVTIIKVNGMERFRCKIEVVVGEDAN